MIHPTNALPIEIGWIPTTNTGWGLLGLHIALGLRRLHRQVRFAPPLKNLCEFPLMLHSTLAEMMQPGVINAQTIRIDQYGNHCPEFEYLPNCFRVLYAVFEDSELPNSAIPQLKRYDLILTPSRWAHDRLARLGVPSTIWHQGYDESLFIPGLRRRPTGGPLYVFSGGKLEFRKGQDIVIESFKRFKDTAEGNNAILVTSWHNPWIGTVEGISESGYVSGTPIVRNGTFEIGEWLGRNGISRKSHIELGQLSQEACASALRECDIALFTNRCEGATNMVLVEALACGVPSIVSQNTGHLDVASEGIYRLTDQTPVRHRCALYRGMAGWGESNPAECVLALRAFAAGSAQRRANLALELARAEIKNSFGWHGQARTLDNILKTRFG